MNVVLILSHAIEEFDQLRLFHEMGVNVFSIGGYIRPGSPHDDKRPALPQVPEYPDLIAAVDNLGTADNLRAAQERIPDAVLDWADVIVQHHLMDRLWGQFDRIEKWLAAGSHRRVIWRTVGQSVDGNEYRAQPFRQRGLQIVRYSPKERAIPNFAGEDALIRFYKDPAEWAGWHGSDPVVGNVTQHMVERAAFCNLDFYLAATEGLSARPAGPGAEKLPGGIGPLAYDEMREYLRRCRVYLYTGTQPASYTLGLIEAMMTGTPVVSIGPSNMNLFPPYSSLLFEGHELAEGWDHPHGPQPYLAYHRDPLEVRNRLAFILEHDDEAQAMSAAQRAFAIQTFGIETVSRQWAAFLGVPVREAVAA